jgi:CRISPR/Cas system CMR-associated protein Cmr5 small subunit
MLWVVSEVEKGETKIETTFSESNIRLIAIHKKNGLKKTAYFTNGKIDWIKEWGKNKIEMSQWDSTGQVKSYYLLKNGCEIYCLAGGNDDTTIVYSCFCGDLDVIEKEGIYVDSNDVPVNKRSLLKEIEYFPNGKRKSMLVQKGQEKKQYREWNNLGVLVKEESE